MRKKLGLATLIVTYLTGLIYLSLPNPTIIDLKDALKSTEPGDTWQNKNTAAYFTNLDRKDIVNFYRNSYALHFGPWTLPSLRLNYPVEDTAVYVRKYIMSYYLEEIVHPLRESVFINGWNPQLSPLNAHLTPQERALQTIVVDGQVFSSKATLKWYPSSAWARILVWTLIIPCIYFTFISIQNSTRYLAKYLKMS